MDPGKLPIETVLNTLKKLGDEIEKRGASIQLFVERIRDPWWLERFVRMLTGEQTVDTAPLFEDMLLRSTPAARAATLARITSPHDIIKFMKFEMMFYRGENMEAALEVFLRVTKPVNVSYFLETLALMECEEWVLKLLAPHLDDATIQIACRLHLTGSTSSSTHKEILERITDQERLQFIVTDGIGDMASKIAVEKITDIEFLKRVEFLGSEPIRRAAHERLVYMGKKGITAQHTCVVLKSIGSTEEGDSK